ncbi:hypothetical protein EK21DRAFT_94575 [Setomelanomma holmii]|uniref:Uncharacterized protein n=1 Tax=Setomelanomma holmii TaxID=210430 RepID=A0A9P4GW77_9PLEO|nr:hypothetical protein EK21DRAFT_94575 [Setomelanomma holmii]
MFSTTMLNDDVLETLGQLSLTTSKVQIMRAQDDPHQREPFVSSEQRKPEVQDHDHFPPFLSPSTTSRGGLPLPGPTPFLHTYSDVLVYDIDRPSIMCLPVEIRGLVREAHMLLEGSLCPGAHEIRNVRGSVPDLDKFGCPPFLPTACRVSKSTKDETFGVFMRNSKFMVASIADNTLRTFVAQIEKGHDDIRELYFDFFDCFGRHHETVEKNADLELAVDCTGLHTLRLTFARKWLGMLVKPDPYSDLTLFPHTVDSLVGIYRLRRLLACGDNLRKIYFDGLSWDSGPVQVLTDLANWV